MWIGGIQLFLLTAISHLFLVQCKKGSNYFRAAVLEHVRFGNFSHSPAQILNANLKTYEIAAKTAAENGADIFVFPEWGLYPHNRGNRKWIEQFAEDVPDPKKEFSNPCSQTDLFQDKPVLKKLSCLAYQYKIYLVANMADAKKCSNRGSCDASEIDSCAENYVYCPEDEILIHNTNIVFDRQGTLIARYYKKHLFFEFDMNPPINSENIFFETDFGYFTTFICFDLVFKEPVEAIEKSLVVNVAYPTYWYDTAPFYNLATAFQQSWAIRHKVNLIAANVHNPKSGTLGSGIYSAEKGVLTYTSNPNGRSKILISNVPRFIDIRDELFQNLDVKQFDINGDTAVEIKEEKEIFDNVECLTHFQDTTNLTDTEYNCFQFDNRQYNFAKLNKEEGEIKKCMNNFCCHLSYKVTSLEEDYFLGVFAGDFVVMNSFSFGTETCFLTRCNSNDSGICAKYPTKSKTVFEHITIKGNFESKYIYSSVVDSDLRLTNKKQWIFDGKYQITYHNLNKKSSLLFLGLTGRNYDRDETLKQYDDLYNT